MIALQERWRAALLLALRAAASEVFIDEDHLFRSPRRHVDWIGDVEDAIEEFYDELLALVEAERVTVHQACMNEPMATARINVPRRRT